MMRRIWWSWDIRMRWAFRFSCDSESYINNYRLAIDAARRYGVEAIIIWGFLRDSHGGIETARRIRDYAGERGIRIFPGVGVDSYGGVYYEGAHPYALDDYLLACPESQARNEDGSPATHLWPPTDKSPRRKACPSDEKVLDFYRESLAWLIETFSLDGFQIEHGDTGLCHCERCRARPRIVAHRGQTSVSDGATRIGGVVAPALAANPELTIISETYMGLTRESIEKLRPVLDCYPPAVTLSWQLYNPPNFLMIEEGVASPRAHGCAAVCTNSDAMGGELDDAKNIARALQISKAAGLDMTYIYGEYPDDWPKTRKNYETWAVEST